MTLEWRSEGVSAADNECDTVISNQTRSRWGEADPNTWPVELATNLHEDFTFLAGERPYSSILLVESGYYSFHNLRIRYNAKRVFKHGKDLILGHLSAKWKIITVGWFGYQRSLNLPINYDLYGKVTLREGSLTDLVARLGQPTFSTISHLIAVRGWGWAWAGAGLGHRSFNHQTFLFLCPGVWW